MRYTIYIGENWNDDNGKPLRGSRSHLITLGNETAMNIVMEYLQNLDWLDGIIERDDVLFYNDQLD